MLFNAVSGCDTVFRCFGHGKKSSWLAWRSCPSAIDAVLDLSLQPVDVSSDNPRGNRKVPSCRVQQNVFSQWSMEIVVGTWFSDNGEQPTNQSGIAATCATRGRASGVCVVTGACFGPCPA